MRELAWQAMRYKNKFVRARLAEATGLRVDPSAGDKADVTKKVRKEEKEELSGAVYAQAEREVQATWARDQKRILAGAPLSQWRQNDSLSIRGHKQRAESGVRIEQDGAGFAVDLAVQNKDCDGGCWMRVEVARGTEIDEYQAPLLRLMSSGQVPILKAVVTFRTMRGKTYLRLAYAHQVVLQSLASALLRSELLRATSG